MRIPNGVVAFLAIAVGVAVSSCASVIDTGFTPYSSTSVGQPLVARAVVAYEGDLPGFQSLGSVLIGTVTVQARASATLEEIQGAAAELAARYGGTHIVLSSTSQTQQVSGGGRTGVYTSTTVQCDYLVVQVPPPRWAELPPQLYPAPTAVR
ncbi:MAG: hypothetical protein HY905_11990 [Deltaproteobacteria bacterium]|nr:hypothetical protein [Deltaproteobacteria bacterium]